MNRIGDWEKALARYLAAARDEPFVYGTNDCALFVAGAVLAMTGEDPAAEFRGKYRSQATSVRALHEAGYDDLEAVMDAKFVETPVGHARRGDVVLFEGSLGIAFADFAVFTGEEEGKAGLVRIARADWDKAWSVG